MITSYFSWLLLENVFHTVDLLDLMIWFLSGSIDFPGIFHSMKIYALSVIKENQNLFYFYRSTQLPYVLWFFKIFSSEMAVEWRRSSIYIFYSFDSDMTMQYYGIAGWSEQRSWKESSWLDLSKTDCIKD